MWHTLYNSSIFYVCVEYLFLSLYFIKYISLQTTWIKCRRPARGVIAAQTRSWKLRENLTERNSGEWIRETCVHNASWVWKNGSTQVSRNIYSVATARTCCVFKVQESSPRTSLFNKFCFVSIVKSFHVTLCRRGLKFFYL